VILIRELVCKGLNDRLKVLEGCLKGMR